MNKSRILDFIKSSPAPVSKRDIAQAFRLKGSGPRVAMKKMLKELYNEGAISKQGGSYSVPAGLPGVCAIVVSDIDIDGDLFARPLEWDVDTQGEPPRIEVMPERKGQPALSVGDLVLARMSRSEDNIYEARTISRMDAVENQVMGLLRVHKNGAILQPADKKARYEFEVSTDDLNGAKDGDLVVGEIQPAHGSKRKKARIVEILGQRGDPKAISVISLHEAGLCEKFPDDVLAQSEGLTVPTLKGRDDLRKIPLVTIDGADARDFDDAVFAEKTDEGYHLIVAIADVAYYVRHGKALDNEAQKRGNSTYFPDRVVPMLPEALSNDLCSLRPREDRACMAVHMWIDESGALEKYKFVRGLMRSEARLIYEDVQAGYDAQKHEQLSLINPLYEAFKILDEARQKRGALDLDLPERQIIIDDKGNMTGVQKRMRLDAHKMIEEFMVLANVAAARALEDKKAPCVYRIHDTPSLEKLNSAREFIESFGLSFPKGQVMQPKQINQILRKAAKLSYSHLISMVVLRTQSQAVYHPNNIGHFGLALNKYAHFTSPIRRYADLLVHRSLINAYGLGEGGLDEAERTRLEEICQHISTTERTSMVAERSATDRFTAAFLSQTIGAEFTGKITGVTRFGLFVCLDESGADGIVPMRSLPDDYYIHDEQAHALIGRRRGRVFRLGAPVTVKLIEADGLTGSTVLNLVGHEDGAQIPGVEFKPKRSQRFDNKSGKKPKFKKKTTTPKHKKKATKKKKHKSHDRDA